MLANMMNSPGLSDVAMLTKTTTTNTAEIGENSGIDSELIDSSLLFSAAGVARVASIGLQASRGKEDWITLFRALAELTCVHAEVGDPRPLFSMPTLLEKCAALDPDARVYWLSEDDTARKKFVKAWEKLVETFIGLESNLRQRAEKQRVAARVFPGCQSDVLDKRSKLYGFRLIGMVLPEPAQPALSLDSTQNFQSQAGSIEYVEEMEVYPIPGVRRPLRINVHGWRSLALTLPPVVAAFLCLSGAWVISQLWISELSARQILQGTFVVVVIAAMLTSFVWPLYRVLEDKIVVAPGLLQLALLYNHVLVTRKEASTNILRMLRFTGTCPLCGGLVEIEKGRGEFRGRFVGKCGRNPLEHLFSFDHTLRRGRWLRS